MAFGKIKGAVKKAAKKAGRGAAKQVRKVALTVGEATPGYGSYAKTMRKLTREGKGK